MDSNAAAAAVVASTASPTNNADMTLATIAPPSPHQRRMWR